MKMFMVGVGFGFLLALMLLTAVHEPLLPDAEDCKARGKESDCWKEVDRLRGHGEPVGASVINDQFFCRDAQGKEWKSHGECD